MTMEVRNYTRIGETVTFFRLENGLPVYVNHKPGFHKSYAFFATHYGGMDMRFQQGGVWHDTPAGVAHFLEHKLFDTEDGNALQDLTMTGASPNAFTSSEITGYLFDCTKEFEKNLEILLNFVSVPYFTQESVDKEQGIIGQEIGMILDSPVHRVYYQALEAVLAHHPARAGVIGTIESIAQITPEILYACHGAFYHPGNMVLVVEGDIDAQRVRAIAQECLPQTALENPPRDYGAQEPENPAQSEIVTQMDVSLPLFLLAFKADPPGTGEAALRARLAGQLACAAVMGTSSPLYARLYADGLLAKNYSYEYLSMNNIAMLCADGESKDPRAVRDAVLAEAARIGREGLDPTLFTRLKRAAYGTMVQKLNSFEDTCVEMAKGHFFGLDYLRFPEVFDSIEQTDVEAVIRTLMTPARAALSLIIPKEAMQ